MALEYMPSAMWPRAISCLRIYYRYVTTGLIRGFDAKLPKTRPDGEEDKNVILLTFPDRELLLVWRPIDYPDSSVWDGYIDLSPYEDGTAGRKIVDSVLLSAHNATDKNTRKEMAVTRPGSNIYDRSTYNHSGLEIIGDSGGAQLTSGKTHWVDPHEVIQWYNRGVDVGMALDIPPREVDQIHRKVIKAAALAQKKSNKIYQSERAPELKLLNVLHGFDLEQTRMFMDIVGDGYDWDGWAIGSCSWMQLSVVRNCLVAIKEGNWPTQKVERRIPKPVTCPMRAKKKDGNFGYRCDCTGECKAIGRIMSGETQSDVVGDLKRQFKHEVTPIRPYKYMHLFAVSGENRIPAIAWLSRYVDRFTVDSTLWMQGIRYNRYLSLAPNGAMTTYPMGRERTKPVYKESQRMPIPGTPLPCPCPICTILPSWDVFSLPPVFRTYVLLGWHNIFVLRRFTQLWSDMAHSLDEKHFRRMAAYVLGDWAHLIIDFIETSMHDSLEKAEKRHQLTFAFEKQGKGASHQIFPGTKDEDPGDPMTLLGAANLFSGSTKPSILEDVLCNYLPEKTFVKLGLEAYPPTKDRKKFKLKKKPRRRYTYQHPKRAEIVDTIRQYIVDHPDCGFGEDVIETLRTSKLRKAFMKEHGIDRPKSIKTGVKELISDADIAKERAKKDRRYRKRKVKRSLKK